MVVDSSGKKAVWAYGLGTTPKRCELQLFFAVIRRAVRRLKGLHLGHLNMQFQQDCLNDKKYSSFNFLAENFEKFRSTELYGAPLEGSTIFLKRIFSCRMSMESYRLAELKYAFFSRTGCKTKKLPCSNLFIWTVFKYGLLEGSTILLQYIAITCTPLESSRFSELNMQFHQYRT